MLNPTDLKLLRPSDLLVLNSLINQQVKAKHITIDIETGFAPDAEIQQQIERWKPAKNLKATETIEAKRQEFIESAKEKSSLTDAAPIVSICLRTDSMQSFAMHCLGTGKVAELNGWVVLEYDTEAAMLQMLSLLLNVVTDSETELVGHNIYKFDLPKMRNRMLRSRIALPVCLVPSDEKQPIYDLMWHGKYFSQELSGEKFFSFDDLAFALGIEVHKGIMSGKEVPSLAEQGEISLILTYNAMDVQKEQEAYLLMKGAING